MESVIPPSALSSLHPGHDWSCAHEKGIQLLMTQKLHEGTEIQGYSGGVSLLSFKQSNSQSRERTVGWVNWGQPGETGRLTDLDSSNNLKVVVPVGDKRRPIDFRKDVVDMKMIWQDTGVKVVRAQWKRNQNQNKMPDHLIDLKEMWTLAENPWMRNQDSEGNPWNCFICTSSASPQLPEHPALKCALCLLPSHTCCMESVVSSFDSNEFALPSVAPVPDDNSVNPIFRSPERLGLEIEQQL